MFIQIIPMGPRKANAKPITSGSIPVSKFSEYIVSLINLIYLFIYFLKKNVKKIVWSYKKCIVFLVGLRKKAEEIKKAKTR